jgi:hypothetical protein
VRTGVFIERWSILIKNGLTFILNPISIHEIPLSQDHILNAADLSMQCHLRKLGFGPHYPVSEDLKNPVWGFWVICTSRFL